MTSQIEWPLRPSNLAVANNNTRCERWGKQADEDGDGDEDENKEEVWARWIRTADR